MTVFFYYHQKISELDFQLHTLAKKQLENTFFIIDNDKYNLQLRSIKYINNKKNYLKSLNNELIIYYDIFTNIKHVGEASYSINIKRNSVNQEYYINNKIDDKNHRTCIAELYISFIDFYYKIITETGNIYSYIAQEEGTLAYNNNGILTKTGTVHYLISFNNSKKETTFKSEFVMSKFDEELLIPVKISYKEPKEDFH